MSDIIGNKKVLIGPSSFAFADISPLNRLIESGFEVIMNPHKRKLTKSEIINLLSDGVIGLIAGLELLDREVLEKSKLKVISRSGSGMSNIDIQAAKELGIIVKSTPLAPVTAVAELTIGCLISLIRKVSIMDANLHNRVWSKQLGRQLKDMNVAIIGFGNIGRRVGQLLSAFGSTVFAVDPIYSHSNRDVDNNIIFMDLDSAIKKADVITLHCSGEKTVLGEHEFSLMRKGVFILNVARGELIDELALAKALDNKIVNGAWIDTFKVEPYDGILCKYEQVILTPHIGSFTLECRREMEMEAVENLIDALK